MKIEVEGSSTDSQLVQPEPRVNPLSQNRIMFAALGLGGLSGIPYASPAFRAANGNYLLGTIFVGGTGISYGCAATWGWNHLLNEFTHKYHSGEFKTKRAVAHAAAACLMACFSSGMNFSISHRYNNSLIFPMMAFVNWYGIDATGYYKIIGFAAGITPPAVRREESDWEKIIKKAIMIFPVGNLIVNSCLSIKSGRELVGDNWYALPFAVLALSTFALDVFSAFEIVDQMFAPENQGDSEMQYSRLCQLLFKVISLTLITVATSSDFFIASDTFNHTVAGDVLGATAVVSGVILGKYLLDDLSRELFFRKKPVSHLLANDEKTPLLLEEKTSAVTYS